MVVPRLRWWESPRFLVGEHLSEFVVSFGDGVDRVHFGGVVCLDGEFRGQSNAINLVNQLVPFFEAEEDSFHYFLEPVSPSGSLDSVYVYGWSD